MSIVLNFLVETVLSRLYSMLVFLSIEGSMVAHYFSHRLYLNFDAHAILDFGAKEIWFIALLKDFFFGENEVHNIFAKPKRGFAILKKANVML